MKFAVLLFLPLMLLSSCDFFKKKDKPDYAPWGDVMGGENGTNSGKENSGNADPSQISLADIVNAGELIVLTMSGPDTYYDYHGHGIGLHYLLCEKFANKLGVSLRVELCKDTTEMINRLQNGEADIIAFPLKEAGKTKDETTYKSLTLCGVHDSLRTYSWAVAENNKELISALDSWFQTSMIASTQQEMKTALTTGFVKRHVYPAMLNQNDAVISSYDNLFRKYAGTAHLDWTLIAAQCYQESCFDPKAHSWAGACGLMQIMPKTADHLGLARDKMYEPEPNIAAACKLMAELQQKYQEVPNRNDRICFALASYNAGSAHIRDAMNLAKKNGKNPNSWKDVREYVLALQSPEYYKDPVVKYGYMRGSETAGYVDKIMERWNMYRGATKGRWGSAVIAQPTRSTYRNKWDK